MELPLDTHVICGIVFKTKPASANSTAKSYSLTTTMVLDAAGNLGIIGQTNPTWLQYSLLTSPGNHNE